MGDRLQTGEPDKGLAGAAVSPVLYRIVRNWSWRPLAAWRVVLWDPSVGSGPNSAGSVWPAGNNGHASRKQNKHITAARCCMASWGIDPDAPWRRDAWFYGTPRWVLAQTRQEACDRLETTVMRPSGTRENKQNKHITAVCKFFVQKSNNAADHQILWLLEKWLFRPLSMRCNAPWP
jgi:hypothetical protein